jgi:hypothetical protein
MLCGFFDLKIAFFILQACFSKSVCLNFEENLWPKNNPMNYHLFFATILIRE